MCMCIHIHIFEILKKRLHKPLFTFSVYVYTHTHIHTSKSVIEDLVYHLFDG